MVPLVGKVYTICISLIANGTISKEIGANGIKIVIPLVPVIQMLQTNGTIGRTPNTRYILECLDQFTEIRHIHLAQIKIGFRN